MWHWLLLMKFINLTNECLNHFFVISKMVICKPMVKFVESLTSLIKKNVQPLKNIYIYNFIKMWAFNHRKWGLFPRKFFFGWGLRPWPNLPRPWASLTVEIALTFPSQLRRLFKPNCLQKFASQLPLNFNLF